jgi:predicted esterase
MTPVSHHITVPRTARYITLGEIESAEEVWFVLHGYSMLAASFLRWFEPVARPGRLLVAPEALSRAYVEEKGIRRVGASWMTKEDRDAEIEDYVRYLDLMGSRVLAGVPGKPRIEIHGFSQGTATACRWVSFGHLQAERLMLWSGLVPPDLPLDRYGPVLDRNGLELAFGSRDSFIHTADVDREQARLAAAGLTPRIHRFEGGHRVDRGTLESLIKEDE